MKIITLTPVKNEAWILKFSLKNYSKFSDEIILLNDNSTDNIYEIVKEFPKVTLIEFKDTEKSVNMSARRKALLGEGRKRGGTHFIWLDADEILSSDFVMNIQEHLSSVKNGETIMLPWILVQRCENNLFANKLTEGNYKDFIQFDNNIDNFEDTYLSESRTPNANTRVFINLSQGRVYHLQLLDEKRNNYKNAWYRCQELICGKKTPRFINATYDFTKSLISNKTEIINDSYVLENINLINTKDNYVYHYNQIIDLFNKYGIKFFEPLDIWHIEELRNEFISREGRKPKAKTFLKIILLGNDLKNKIINFLMNYAKNKN